MSYLLTDPAAQPALVGARDEVITAPPTEAGPYRPDVDGLRAVAILSVLAFHAFPQWLPGGFTGVDVFFVISGFLISRIVFTGLSAGTFSFRHFYARRVRRIFPSLTVILILALGLGWMIQPPQEYEQLGRHVAAGAGFLSNIALWMGSGYFDSAADTKPLLHLWSLGIEEQFYIVFPLLVFLAWRLRIARMPFLCAIAAASFATSLFLVTRDPSAAFYLPHARCWELIAGCLLAQASTVESPPNGHGVAATTRVSEHTLRNLVSITGLLLVIAGLMRIDETRDFPGGWALLPTVGAVFLIWAGPGAIVNRRLLSQPLLVWVGLISFQLYLWHWPLLVFLHISNPEHSGFATPALAIAASFPLAWATYARIDKPVRAGPRSSAKVAVACAALAITGVAGWSIHTYGGFPGRSVDSLVDMANYNFQYGTAFREGTCFLKPEQGFGQFGACTRTVAGSDSVVLWGDSHAAHLYRGLEEAAHDRFTLTQLTASWCAPILDLTDIHARPHCRAINDGVFARIVRERPQEVILAAYWPSYPWENLPATIDGLLAAGVGRVLVVGPGPRWNNGVPQLLHAQAREDVLSHRIPLRLPTGESAKQNAFDARFAKAVARAGVGYVSVLEILCNDSGCLARTRDDDPSSLMYWDIFHLTTEGSKYLVSHFPKGSLPDPR